MKDSTTFKTEHLTAEIEWLGDAGSDDVPHCFVSIAFGDGGTLTMCGDCVPEFLDLLRQVNCSINEQTEVLAN